MIKDLASALNSKDMIVQQLLKNGTGKGGANWFAEAEMDGIVVLDDVVASKFLEAYYVYDTHIAPGMLPGGGMTIGDVFNNGEDVYMTFHIGVAEGNTAAMHYMRQYENLYFEWTAKRKDCNRQVKELVEQAKALNSKCFGIRSIAEFNHIGGYVGFDDILCPSSEFVGDLNELASKLSRARQKGFRALARTSQALAQELSPYTVFSGVFKNIRKNHKGLPIYHDGMMGVSSPTASGGANLHTGTVSDDLTMAIPGGSGLSMVAIQAGNFSNMQHFGTGSRPGEHYWLLPPKTPFFELTQALIEADSSLLKSWKNLSVKLGTGKGKTYWVKSGRWSQVTRQIKQNVAREVIPTLIGERVLGFHIDMNQKPFTALIRPVISNSSFERNSDLITQSQLQVIRPGYKDLLVEDSRGYYKFPLEYQKAAIAG